MSNITIEIHLSLATPQQVIQEIKAFVVDSPAIAETHAAPPKASSGILRVQVRGSAIFSGYVRPRLVRLIPVGDKTDKPSLVTSFAVLLYVVQLAYYVSGTADGTADYTIQFLEQYQRYFRETKIDGLVVPFDQVKKAIQTEERPSNHFEKRASRKEWQSCGLIQGRLEHIRLNTLGSTTVPL
jgi:hypothetical protein